jgi:hypothetical protein
MDESKVAINPWLHYSIFFRFSKLTIGCYDDVNDKTCPKWGLNLHLFGHNPKFLPLDHHFKCWNKVLSKIYINPHF